MNAQLPPGQTTIDRFFKAQGPENSPSTREDIVNDNFKAIRDRFAKIKEDLTDTILLVELFEPHLQKWNASTNGVGSSEASQRAHDVIRSLVNAIGFSADRISRMITSLGSLIDTFHERAIRNIDKDNGNSTTLDIFVSGLNGLLDRLQRTLATHDRKLGLLRYGLVHNVLFMESDMLSAVVKFAHLDYRKQHRRKPLDTISRRRIQSVMEVCLPRHGSPSGTPGYGPRDYALLLALEHWKRGEEPKFSAGPWGTAKLFRRLAEM